MCGMHFGTVSHYATKQQLEKTSPWCFDDFTAKNCTITRSARAVRLFYYLTNFQISHYVAKFVPQTNPLMSCKD